MKTILLICSAVLTASLFQCKSPKEANKGVICIEDSVAYPGDSTRHVYLYYRDFGLFGRSISKYVAIEKAGRYLQEEKAFYSDIQTMQLKVDRDSLYIITSNKAAKYVASDDIKYRVIVDTQTWKYPSAECHPVDPVR